MPDALVSRALALSTKRDYANALADLDRAIALGPGVESYYVRAQIYETRGETDRAVTDFRKATELPPKGFFDLVAQIDAKKHIDKLGRSVPCGSSGRGSGTDTCL
jgi:tetratricopeptide (TPR) repeat protein